MTKDGRRRPDAPSLFDLPLEPPTEPADEPRPEPMEPAEEPTAPETQILTPPLPGPATAGALLAASLFDFLALVAVLTIALVGSVTMGVALNAALLAPVGIFGVVFSFLYYVLPLAFWGKTPGMSWAQVVARNEGDRPLTFGQTAVRWLAAVLTVALVGLPLLLALGGRPLADRMSRSRTLRS